MKRYFKVISIILIFTVLLAAIPISTFAETIEDYQAPEITDVSGTGENPVEVTQSKVYNGAIICELEDERQVNVKRFIKYDSTIDAVVYPTAVHYVDNEGKFIDIDNTLIESDDENGNSSLENKDSDFKVKIAKDASSNNFIKIKKNNHEIEWNILNANQSK